jgi:hypothetical protein
MTTKAKLVLANAFRNQNKEVVEKVIVKINNNEEVIKEIEKLTKLFKVCKLNTYINALNAKYLKGSK